MLNLTIKSGFESKYRDGYPLISKESVEDWSKVSQEGRVVNLFDYKKKFIAKGYHGIQNKGYGWVLTQNKDELIDVEFFKKKIKDAIKYRKDF